jgi:hypothetical protein
VITPNGAPCSDISDGQQRKKQQAARSCMIRRLVVECLVSIASGKIADQMAVYLICTIPT